MLVPSTLQNRTVLEGPQVTLGFRNLLEGLTEFRIALTVMVTACRSEG